MKQQRRTFLKVSEKCWITIFFFFTFYCFVIFGQQPATKCFSSHLSQQLCLSNFVARAIKKCTILDIIFIVGRSMGRDQNTGLIVPISWSLMTMSCTIRQLETVLYACPLSSLFVGNVCKYIQKYWV